MNKNRDVSHFLFFFSSPSNRGENVLDRDPTYADNRFLICAKVSLSSSQHGTRREMTFSPLQKKRDLRKLFFSSSTFLSFEEKSNLVAILARERQGQGVAASPLLHLKSLVIIFLAKKKKKKVIIGSYLIQ